MWEILPVMNWPRILLHSGERYQIGGEFSIGCFSGPRILSQGPPGDKTEAATTVPQVSGW